MNHAKTRLLLLSLAAVLVGCSSAPKKTASTPTAETSPPPTASATPSTTATVAPPPVLAAHLDPNSLIYQQRSVYFDFNDYTIKTDYAEMIERQGKYLVSAPGLNIKVEGNTDERGSAEYNLSLGQRRAEAVVKALKIYGVRDSQVEAISWGEEKPLAKGNDETAWAQNRRVDLMYPTR